MVCGCPHINTNTAPEKEAVSLTRTAIVETVGIKKKRGFCAIISTNALVQSARITLAQLVLC